MLLARFTSRDWLRPGLFMLPKIRVLIAKRDGATYAAVEALDDLAIEIATKINKDPKKLAFVAEFGAIPIEWLRPQ